MIVWAGFDTRKPKAGIFYALWISKSSIFWLQAFVRCGVSGLVVKAQITKIAADAIAIMNSRDPTQISTAATLSHVDLKDLGQHARP